MLSCAARRARSRRECVSRLGVVEEEADGLQLLEALEVVQKGDLQTLQSEADQLVAITVAARKTARRKGV